MALFVNERTLLPVLLPLAPASTLVDRFPTAMKDVLMALDTPTEFIDYEIRNMDEVSYSKTQNRSVLGIVNQFVYLAEGYRDMEEVWKPLAIALKLSTTPCSPLYKGAVFPEKALRELVKIGQIQ